MFVVPDTMTYTDFSVQLMSASVIMFAVGDCMALANIFWALAAIVRLLRRACCSNTSSKTYSQEEIVEYREGELYPEKSPRSREIITTSYPYEDSRPYVSDRIVSRY